MPKIIINSSIKSSDTTDVIKNKQAIKNTDLINFYHDGVNNKIELKKDKVKLTRDSKESLIILEFEQDKTIDGKYVIKDLSLNMNIKVSTKKLQIDDNGFKIEYDLFINDVYSDSFIYEFEWRC